MFPLITILDENDNPPQFTENPYGFEAPEDTPVGSSVGQISASDADVDSAGTCSVLFICYKTHSFVINNIYSNDMKQVFFFF